MAAVFRPATPHDLDAILPIFTAARAYLAQQGVDQWQDGYPTAEIILADMARGESYLMEADGAPTATMAVCRGTEPTYLAIYEGAWGSSDAYAAFHRVAVASGQRGSGLAAQMLASAEAMCHAQGLRNIRIDTHRHNLPMQRFLQKQGFVRRGIIYLADGAERLAFDKQLR